MCFWIHTLLAIPSLFQWPFETSGPTGPGHPSHTMCWAWTYLSSVMHHRHQWTCELTDIWCHTKRGWTYSCNRTVVHTLTNCQRGWAVEDLSRSRCWLELSLSFTTPGVLVQLTCIFMSSWVLYILYREGEQPRNINSEQLSESQWVKVDEAGMSWWRGSIRKHVKDKIWEESNKGWVGRYESGSESWREKNKHKRKLDWVINKKVTEKQWHTIEKGSQWS